MKKYLSKHYWRQVDMEQVIGLMLRWGVIASAIVTSVGGILYLVQAGGKPRPVLHHFTGEAHSERNIGDIFQNAVKGQSTAIIEIGILILIATPIARVIFSIFAFLVEKDYLYTVFTVIVLGIILYSLLGGLG
jgi:uncharacterized membrane protein